MALAQLVEHLDQQTDAIGGAKVWTRKIEEDEGKAMARRRTEIVDQELGDQRRLADSTGAVNRKRPARTRGAERARDAGHGTRGCRGLHADEITEVRQLALSAREPIAAESHEPIGETPLGERLPNGTLLRYVVEQRLEPARHLQRHRELEQRELLERSHLTANPGLQDRRDGVVSHLRVGLDRPQHLVSTVQGCQRTPALGRPQHEVARQLSGDLAVGEEGAHRRIAVPRQGA
jgi:hypothetical protein